MLSKSLNFFFIVTSTIFFLTSTVSSEFQSQSDAQIDTAMADTQNLVHGAGGSEQQSYVSSRLQSTPSTFFPSSSPSLLIPKQYQINQQLNKIVDNPQNIAYMQQQGLSRDDYASKDYSEYASHQQIYPQYGFPSYGPPSSSYGPHGGYDLDEFGTSSIGGLGGFAALLGLKGLKGLGVLGFIKAALLPALGFVIPLLVVLPLVLLFLPIPIITVGGSAKRSLSLSTPASIMGYEFPDLSEKASSISRAILDSEKCVERVSCEISRYSQGSWLDRAVKMIIQRFEDRMPNSIKRMAKAYMNASVCKRYGCFIMDDNNNYTAKSSSTKAN